MNEHECGPPHRAVADCRFRCAKPIGTMFKLYYELFCRG
nr:MAG TPA: hypothetical protein [Crassvirales sp.]